MRSAALRVTSTRLLPKMRFLRRRQQEIERADALRQVAQGDALDGIEELGVEIVNPELVEVAEDDVGRAVAGRCGSSNRRPGRNAFRDSAPRDFISMSTRSGPEQVGEFLAAFRFRASVAFDQFELGGARLFRDAKLESRASLDARPRARARERSDREKSAPRSFRRPSAHGQSA